MKKNRINTIILLGSSPDAAVGGAGKIISSYINHYLKNKINYFFIPIHTMKVKRIYRILPIISSIFKSINIRFKYSKDIFVIHHHHTTILDLLTFSIIKTIIGVDRQNCFITFHNPKHFQNIKLLDEFRNCTLSSQIFRGLFIKKILFQNYFQFLSFLSGNFHFLNSINYKIVKKLITKNTKVKILPNPLSENQKLFLINNLKKNLKDNISENKIIGTYSAMRKGKRLDRAIKMLNYLPKNYSLIIGGKGSEEIKLKKLVLDLNLNSRVKFIGWMDEEMKIKFFKSIDFFVITSDADTQSLVFLEAIINCKPVISVPNPIFKEIYPEGICAIYSKEAKYKSLADEIISFKVEKLSYKKSAQYILDQQKSFSYAENLLK